MPYDKDREKLFKMNIEMGETFGIDLDLNRIYLNWKPDSILKLKEVTNIFKKKKDLQEGDLDLKTDRQTTVNSIVNEILSNKQSEKVPQLKVKDKFE